MNDILKSIMEIGIELINGVFINFSAIWFLLGLVIFLMGAFFIGVSIYARAKGRPVKGKIIGAVHKTRIKQKIRDGKKVEKIKTESYFVYEYKKPDGSTHKELSSQGFQKNTSYKTGDEIDLLVCPAKGFDDVYDPNDKSPIILGLVFLAIGGALLGSTVGTYGMKKSFWVLIVLMIIPAFMKMHDKISDHKDANRGKEKSPRPPSKQFEEGDIKTVEDVIALMKSKAS